MKRISFIAISGILIFSASTALAYEFTGPTTQPTGGNVPGVIWNVDGTSVTQPTAKINFGLNSDGSNHPGGANYKSDIGLTDTRAFRIDKVGASTFNMGNWGAGQQPFTFGVYGDIKMYNFGGLPGQRGRMDAVEYCINGGSCITAWPSGGGGGVTTISVGSGLTVTNPSGPTATIGLLSSCASGQMLKWNGTAWACSNDNNSGGTISTLTAGTGITITNPSGPNATINATNNGTLTGITAGTGATVSGSAPSPTINVTDLYVNTTGDYMTGQLSLTANNTQTGGSLYAESTAPATYTNCDSSPSACGAKGKGKEAGLQGIGRVGVWGIGNDYGATGRAISGGYFSNLSGTINASIGTPSEAIKAQGQITATNLSGWGGYFWGSYGVGGRGYGTNAHAVDAYIGSDVTNGHAGYFDAQNALGTSYGLYVRGPSTGAAGRFVDAGTNRAVELASQSTNLALSVSGNTRLGSINDTTTVSGTLTLIAPSSRLCLGTSGGVPDCRTSWPSGGLPGGVNGNVQFNNSGSFGGDSGLFWDNTNKRLGVGTTAPTQKLQVSGNIRADNSVQYNNVISAYNTANYSFAGYFQSSGNGAYGIDARSNTACGGVFNFMNATAAPVNQVLAGCGSTAGALSVSVSDSSLATRYAIATNGNVFLGGGAGGGTAANTGNLYLPTGGGIGFDGNRDLTALLSLSTSNIFEWYMGTGNRIEIFPSGGGTSAYYLPSNGDMLIRGTTAGYRFSDRANNANLWSLYSNNGWAYLYQGANRFGVSASGNVYVPGNLGIGTSSPSYQLQLSTNSAAKPTSNVWTVASDSRLKDIRGNYSKGLDEIIKLNPIIYSYKKDNPYNYPSDTIGQGAIAQEVQKIFPEAVTKDAKGYLQLDTNSINWATINAIKELKAENDKLKTQNASLEWRLRTLEAKVDSLMK